MSELQQVQESLDLHIKYRVMSKVGQATLQSMNIYLSFVMSPHFSPPYYCDGALPRPVGILLGQGPRHRVNYACGPLCRHIC